MTGREITDPRQRRAPSPDSLAALERGREESARRFTKVLPWIFGASIVQASCAIVRRYRGLDSEATWVDYTLFGTTLLSIAGGLFILACAMRAKSPTTKAS